jgi:hypothetical protein
MSPGQSEPRPTGITQSRFVDMMNFVWDNQDLVQWCRRMPDSPYIPDQPSSTRGGIVSRCEAWPTCPKTSVSHVIRQQSSSGREVSRQRGWMPRADVLGHDVAGVIPDYRTNIIRLHPSRLLNADMTCG